MPFVETHTGANLHYEDVGAGPVVILVHGMFGTARTHFDATIHHLSQHYRVIGPSLRGYGLSTPKPRDFPPDFYQRDAEDVLALMDALAIESAHVVGYSDGGEAALIAAGLQPERFRTLTTIGAVGYFGPQMRPAVQRMYPVDWVSDEARALHDIDNPTPMVMQWIRSMKMMIDLGGAQSLPFAENITCPVLMLLGEQDTLNPAAYAQVFLDRVRDGRLQLFPGGHAVHDHHPDVFMRTLEAFLE
jgi:valacyclovir hydrolase